VALRELVHDTLPLVQALADRHGVVLRTGRLDGWVTADPMRLRQVLLNLLTNAIKYNRPQGEVRIDSQPQPDTVVLRIVDSGRGMTAEQLKNLFEPFNRLGAEREDIEGTGIGLPIVKALVDLMHGRIEVASSPDSGTCFELVLGAAQAPQAPSTQPPPAAPAGSPARRIDRSGTVLYIEDNPVNVLLVEELLGSCTSLRVESAGTGALGVARARSLRPDLILVDIQLPDFDGFEVLRRLRAQPETADIRCVALSANAMPEEVALAMQAGFVDYWTKPIAFAGFLGALDALLAEADAAG
jgi:CheY-like chemotaxis protein/anti-sigma regulatory factor (Ser/Thr protein kinase)